MRTLLEYIGEYADYTMKTYTHVSSIHLGIDVSYHDWHVCAVAIMFLRNDSYHFGWTQDNNAQNTSL